MPYPVCLVLLGRTFHERIDRATHASDDLEGTETIIGKTSENINQLHKRSITYPLQRITGGVTNDNQSHSMLIAVSHSPGSSILYIYPYLLCQTVEFVHKCRPNLVFVGITKGG